MKKNCFLIFFKKGLIIILIFFTIGEHVWDVAQSRRVSWSPPSGGYLKFSVDGARDKVGMVIIGGILCDNKGEVIFMFSKHVGVSDSNDAEVMAILGALHIHASVFFFSFQDLLIVECDLQNSISWMSLDEVGPWKFQFFFNEIKSLSSSIQVVPRRVSRSANGMACDGGNFVISGCCYVVMLPLGIMLV